MIPVACSCSLWKPVYTVLVSQKNLECASKYGFAVVIIIRTVSRSDYFYHFLILQEEVVAQPF